MILALAAAARFQSLDFGLLLPYARPDESRLADRSTRMLEGDWRPASFAYPSLYPMVVAGARWLIDRPGSSGAPGAIVDPIARQQALSYPRAYQVGRQVSALAGVLTVAVLYLLARQFTTRRESLLAALLLALAHLHVRDSHFAVTDATLALATTASLLALVRAARGTNRARWLLAGACLGLAVSVKQTAVWLVVPFCIAAIPRRAKSPSPDDSGAAPAPPSHALRTWLLRCAGAAAAMVATFLLLNPWVVLEPSRFLEDTRFELAHKAAGSGALAERGLVQHFAFSLWHGLGPAYAIAAALGLALAAFRARRDGWIVVSFALAYYLGMASGTQNFARYMLPLIPLAALFAAHAAETLASFLPARARTPAALLIVFAIASLSAARIVATNRVLAAEDTRLQATKFLAEHVKPTEQVLWIGRYSSPPSLGYDPRLNLRDGRQLQSLFPDEADIRPSLAAANYDYVVWATYFFPTQFDASPALTDRLAAALTPLATFSPLSSSLNSTDVHPIFDPHDAFYVPFAELAGFERPGPFMHVYRR